MSNETKHQNIKIWHEAACSKLGFHYDDKRDARPQSLLLNNRIEQTVLGSQATDEDITQSLDIAEKFGFRAVCCLPKDVARCARRLDGTPIRVVTVLNFPLSGGTHAAVAAECVQAIQDGVDELDMVVDIRALRKGDLVAVVDGIRRIVDIAQKRTVKVILETGLLTVKEIVEGTAAVEASGAAYVKTCTGFGPRGVSLEDIVTIRAAVGNRLGVKASGGIRDGAFSKLLIESGADLLGTSSGPQCIGMD